MKKDEIGFNAGKIWQKLERDSRDTKITKLKKELNLNAIEFGIALGWLARENKITFVNDENTTYVIPVD